MQALRTTGRSPVLTATSWQRARAHQAEKRASPDTTSVACHVGNLGAHVPLRELGVGGGAARREPGRARPRGARAARALGIRSHGAPYSTRRCH